MASFRTAISVFGVIVAQVAQANSDSQKPVAQNHGSSKNPLNEEIATFAQESLDLWHVPGMSVGVIDGDNIYTEGYGYATLPDVRATADTLWYGASTSKAQAAALLAHLIQSSNYTALLPHGWETPISSVIRDDFVLQDEWATAHVTLNDAASHRSGQGRHDMARQRTRDGKQMRPRDLVRNLRHLNMLAEPRATFAYCNFMYITLGHVLETVTGQWLGEALREHLWAPLGMDSTHFDTEDALHAPEHFAGGYAWDERTGEYTAIDYMGVTETGAAGAVISNVKDYAKWVRCLLNKSGPLSDETHRDIRKPRMFASAEDTEDGMEMTVYGLGWFRTTIHGQTVFHHSGGMHAYGAEVFWLPEIKFGVVAFGNTATSSNWAELDVIYRLIEDKLGIPVEQRIGIRARSMRSKNKLPTRQAAIEMFFPDRPKTPQPSTFSISQLVGKYKHAGWGEVTFEAAHDPEDVTKTILVGPRPYASYRHTFILEHITGDYWLLNIASEGHSPYSDTYYTVQFVAGGSGEPATMRIDTAPALHEAGDGIVIFTRTE